MLHGLLQVNEISLDIGTHDGMEWERGRGRVKKCKEVRGSRKREREMLLSGGRGGRRT